MKVYDAGTIRNVALVGHTGSGKTQLASAILVDAGMVNRFGKVDDGTTVTDFDEEAIARKHTLSASLAFAEWHRHKINIIDTPGIGNFLSDARAALHVADAAVVVVDGVAGVMVQTEKVWAVAEELTLPRLIVVNRLDRERASFERTLQSLRDSCSRSVIPLQLPIGEEKAFTGVVDLISRKAFIYQAGEKGEYREAPIPADLATAAEHARESLIEMVAESTEKLMEHYFEAGTLTDEELLAGLKSATAAGTLFPVVCTSAALNIGIPQLLDVVITTLPSPAERPFHFVDANGVDASRPADENAPASAFVWKTIADPFAGRITMLRVVSGTLKSDSSVHNKTRDVAERIGSLQLLQGKTPTVVPEIKAGDLGTVAKLKDTLTNDTLGDKADGGSYPPIRFHEPVLSYAIEPKSRGDEDKINQAMHRLEEEDPSIRYSRDPQTKDFLVAGTGQVHVEIAVSRLKKRYGVDVTLKAPKIPYLETIRGKADVQGRHKKQTGGHGQFGDCWIRMEPLERGAKFQFANETFGGSIPRNFIPAIEKGIIETAERGHLAGFPMVDFKVTVYDGSYHDVDSSEMAFKMAARKAFRNAMATAKPVLMEPVMHVEIQAPVEFAGDLMGDLNGRRGRISGMDVQGPTQIIKAHVPMSEMLAYQSDLTSMTQGRASFQMEFDHYDYVPQLQADKVIAAAKALRAGEEVDEDE